MKFKLVVVNVFFLTILLTFWSLTSYNEVWNHETAHKQINSFFANDSGTMVIERVGLINFVGHIDTDTYSFKDNQSRETAYFLHSINEIVGYSSIAFGDTLRCSTVAIFLMFLFLVNYVLIR